MAQLWPGGGWETYQLRVGATQPPDLLRLCVSVWSWVLEQPSPTVSSGPGPGQRCLPRGSGAARCRPEKSRLCCPNTSDDICSASMASRIWGLAIGAGQSLPVVPQLYGQPEGIAGRGRMLAGRRASRSLEQLISWLLTEKRMWIGSYARSKGKPGQKSVVLEYLSRW